MAASPEILEKMRRPLEYASKDNFANLETVRDLHATILQMVDGALSAGTGDEEKLRTIRALFENYDSVDSPEKRRRVRLALETLDALAAEAPASKKKKRRRRRRKRKKETGDVAVDAAEVGDAGAAKRNLGRLGELVTELKGVGPKMAEALERMGIRSVGDLLLTLPRSYQDRRRITPAGDVEVGQTQVVAGEVINTETVGYPRKIFVLTVADDSGELQAKWFNYPDAAAKKWSVGQKVVLCGKIDSYKGELQVAHPDIELIESESDALAFARVVPIYPLTEGITQNAMRKFQKLALEGWSEAFVSGVPASIWGELGLPHPVEALRRLHIPSTDVQIAELTSHMSEDHRALAFDELFVQQLGIAQRRREATSRKGMAYDIQHKPIAQFRDILPFELTLAQERVIDQIKRDMMTVRPMQRLVQGDVGSGKTVVAMVAAIIAASNERQVAFMAPTEVVAQQHYDKAKLWLERIGIKVALLTGSIRPTERDGLYPKVSRGKVDVVIGTHALISEGVTFKKLGLVIIDEQHRFGVEQRAKLAQKGSTPDVLFMTATPIPRSLAMTVFGDLDISAIDEVPEGRKPIATTLLDPSEREQAYDVVRAEVAHGRQAYVVYPTIDVSDLHVESAEEAYARLREELGDMTVGILHGRLTKDEKDGVIQRFRRGAIDVLVATTVIGVGIDVPNATVMVVEGADRFGLADLHQLRGRVGRGDAAAQCLLIPREDASEESYGRLSVLAQTRDGFEIAEADLVQRGMGDVVGVRQAGLPAFRVVDLARDADLLLEARDRARAWVDADPRWQKKESQVIKAVMDQRWEGAGHGHAAEAG